MPYSTVDVDFHSHPKTLLLISLTGDPLADIYPIRLWNWALRYAPGGDLARFSDETIAQGIRSSVEVVEKLRTAGFIDDQNRVHDWKEGSGRYETQTGKGRKRMRVYRARKKRERNAHVTVTSPSRGCLDEMRGDEKRGDEKIPPPTSPSARSNGDKPVTKKKRRKSSVSEEFERFWEVYPDKTGKIKARKAWDIARRENGLPDIDKLLEILEIHKQSRRWKEGFIPLPTTWLNQGRWLDEVERPFTVGDLPD